MPKFHDMGERPLNYDVTDRHVKGKVLIPSGTRHVEIAFRQSPYTYWDIDKGRRVHYNIYRWNGQTIHAA